MVAAKGDVKEDSSYPEMAIANPALKVGLYLPDPEQGFYRGSRFDWSCIIKQVEYEGHTYFSHFRAGQGPHDPLNHDSISGPAEEFGMDAALGFREAGHGESFIKIGIGHLQKSGPTDYFFGLPYKIIAPAPWKITSGADWVQFEQNLEDHRGWGYQYIKRAELVGDQPAMKIGHTLRNTGTNLIDTAHYNHCFCIMDDDPIGRNYKVRYPYAISVAASAGKPTNKDSVAMEEKHVEFVPDTLQSNFWMALDGYRNKAEDNCVFVENSKVGTVLKMTGDKPLIKSVVYAEKTAVCPEPFVSVKVEPEQEFSWDFSFEFMAADK